MRTTEMVSSFFRAIAEWMDPLHAADGRIGASHDLLGWDQMETVTVQCCRFLVCFSFSLFPFYIAPLLPLPPFFPRDFSTIQCHPYNRLKPPYPQTPHPGNNCIGDLDNVLRITDCSAIVPGSLTSIGPDYALAYQSLDNNWLKFRP
ncbi:hypothetical protein B9Z19DRAFT_1108569 [Tuber borchii]|uniref:Uncharacterized protein n=1 Tax=Tuber borchii TaxID=42251 RepID=A0A2T6ZR03_TUBBO|nr:hypothetical protein B9Z19DRAFT_1108569 [Tuber borchii]